MTSMVEFLERKNMRHRLEIPPACSPENSSRYNEPAPVRRRPPRILSSGEYPLSKEQQEDSSTEDSSISMTEEETKEYLQMSNVIRRLKKQLDPLNYTDFWFAAEEADGALDFSNSVRRCMYRTGAFGHETGRLGRWLGVMLLEARVGPHRLDFEVVEDAHLDKMIEEIVDFKSRPPTLPSKELQMVEIASDILRYWRHRFGHQYHFVDSHRQHTMITEMLYGLAFRAPKPATPTGWIPRSANWMSEREAETAFEEGQW